MGWTYAFLNSCEPDNFHASYSPGVLPVELSKIQLYQMRGVTERLCIEEVGVNLILGIRAHEPGEWLIMELLVTIIVPSIWVALVSMIGILQLVLHSFI